MSINSVVGMSCNIFSGFLIGIAIILIIIDRKQFESKDVVIFLFLASIAIGIHGLNHYFGNDFTVLLENKDQN